MCKLTITRYESCLRGDEHYVICAKHIEHTSLQLDNARCEDYKVSRKVKDRPEECLCGGWDVAACRRKSVKTYHFQTPNVQSRTEDGPSSEGASSEKSKKKFKPEIEEEASSPEARGTQNKRLRLEAEMAKMDLDMTSEGEGGSKMTKQEAESDGDSVDMGD